jgi:hypothetical protein
VLALGVLALALVTTFVTWVACETVDIYHQRRAKPDERLAAQS